MTTLKWKKELDRDKISLEDAKREGKSRMPVTKENITAMRKNAWRRPTSDIQADRRDLTLSSTGNSFDSNLYTKKFLCDTVPKDAEMFDKGQSQHNTDDQTRLYYYNVLSWSLGLRWWQHTHSCQKITTCLEYMIATFICLNQEEL